MDEQQRELATNRLLEIIRSSKKRPPLETPPEPEKPPAGEVISPEIPKSPPSTKKTAPSGALERILHRETKEEAVQEKPSETDKPIEVESVKKPLQATETVLTEIQPPAEAKRKVVSPIDETALEVEISPDLLPLPQRVLKSLSGIAKTKLTEKKKPKEVEPVKKEVIPKPKLIKEKPTKPQVKRGGKRIIVLDIGYSSVKMLELVKYKNSLKISSIDSRVIPIKMRKSSSSLDVLISKYIQEMVPPAKLRNAEVRLLISDRNMVYRRVSVPSGAVKELLNAIKFQIKKDLPFEIDRCEISYSGFDAKAKGKQDLEILAVDGKAIDEKMNVMDAVGIIPSVITSSAVTSRYLIKSCPTLSSGRGGIMLVDIGASKTTVTVLDNDKLVLCRTLSAGGDDFTEALTGAQIGPNNTELNEVQAEKYKFDIGMPLDRDQTSLKVSIIFRPILERILTEINRSLDFYRREHPEGEIPRMLLFGGGALMKNLPKFLAENIGIEVILANPLTQMPADKSATCDVVSLAAEVGPVFIPALTVGLSDGTSLNDLTEKTRGQLRLRQVK